MVVDFYKAMKAVTDIKKGLEDGRSLLKGHEGRQGHFKPFFPNSQCRCQVPCILEFTIAKAVHRYIATRRALRSPRSGIPSVCGNPLAPIGNPLAPIGLPIGAQGFLDRG